MSTSSETRDTTGAPGGTTHADGTAHTHAHGTADPTGPNDASGPNGATGTVDLTGGSTDSNDSTGTTDLTGTADRSEPSNPANPSKPSDPSGTAGTADPSGTAGTAVGAVTAVGANPGRASGGNTVATVLGDTGATAPGATDPSVRESTGSAVRGTRLTLRAATLGRPDAAALADVDLDVPPGEILTVVGPSGCGKSTLLRTLAGLLPALAGAVEQDGLPIAGPAADRALVFQEDALLPWRTLLANVELPLAIQGTPRATRRKQAADWLTRVGLADRARQLPHRVSGGQRQRAQLARALAAGPRAVLMDEPFGALDAQTRAGMQDLLVEVLRGTGATVVFVTHDVDEALFLGDRVALLGAGRLVAVRDVPRPRDRAAHDDPARVALRRAVLTSLNT